MSNAVVLDSEGLSRAADRDADVIEWIEAARRADLPVVVSAATIVEAANPTTKRAALDWTLSRLSVEPLTKGLAKRSTALLQEAGRHGHEAALDAMVCATALAISGRVVILTSDPDDIGELTSAHPQIVVQSL
ncbi:MAG: hypothetical protein QM779_05825 [Propionicimonas sp.]|uniref:type II toxin-antitoxin system VapC family toxin n=1 Tax=Propionicimonas sp. TaxID=1955623 RepID=UPI003D0F779F